MRRSGDQDLLGARRQVLGGIVALGEDARAFQRDLDAQIPPGKLGRVADLDDLDLVAVDDHHALAGFDGAGETAVDAVVLQQVRVGVVVGQIVDRDDLDIVAARFVDSPQHQPADTTESIDGNLNSH